MSFDEYIQNMSHLKAFKANIEACAKTVKTLRSSTASGGEFSTEEHTRFQRMANGLNEFHPGPTENTRKFVLMSSRARSHTVMDDHTLSSRFITRLMETVRRNSTKGSRLIASCEEGEDSFTYTRGDHRKLKKIHDKAVKAAKAGLSDTDTLSRFVAQDKIKLQLEKMSSGSEAVQNAYKVGEEFLERMKGFDSDEEADADGDEDEDDSHSGTARGVGSGSEGSHVSSGRGIVSRVWALFTGYSQGKSDCGNE